MGLSAQAIPLNKPVKIYDLLSKISNLETLIFRR